jgi:hypothetical protein
MLQDQDFQVTRTTVASPESEQAGRDLHGEVEKKEHRGMVEEPLVEDRIRVSDPYGVLLPHPKDEISHIVCERRPPAGGPVRIGPIPAYQLTVPPKESLGTDQER